MINDLDKEQLELRLSVAHANLIQIKAYIKSVVEEIRLRNGR